MGMIMVFVSIINYLIDSYLLFAASALAANGGFSCCSQILFSASDVLFLLLSLLSRHAIDSRSRLPSLLDLHVQEPWQCMGLIIGRVPRRRLHPDALPLLQGGPFLFFPSLAPFACPEPFADPSLFSLFLLVVWCQDPRPLQVRPDRPSPSFRPRRAHISAYSCCGRGSFCPRSWCACQREESRPGRQRRERPRARARMGSRSWHGRTEGAAEEAGWREDRVVRLVVPCPP
jgi:hypothetical protein